MGSTHDIQASSVDPENRLLWRMNRRRLDAESLRDSLLAVSGKLRRLCGRARLASGVSGEQLAAWGKEASTLLTSA